MASALLLCHHQPQLDFICSFSSTKHSAVFSGKGENLEIFQSYGRDELVVESIIITRSPDLIPRIRSMMASSSHQENEFPETEPSPPNGSVPPEPNFPDFEPIYPDGSKVTWDGDPDEPRTPEPAAELTDSDDENPPLFGRDLQENQAQRWLAQKKWGLIVYRCTHCDDAKWAQFMETFEAMGRCNTVDDPGLDNTLTFDVRDVEVQYKNADLVKMSESFEKWIRSDDIKTEIRDEDLEIQDKDADFMHRIYSIQINKLESSFLQAPRYVYFIYVDDAAMESVLAMKDDSGWWRSNYTGWVNVVNTRLLSGHAGRDLQVAVRKVTPSHLYPEYYKSIYGPGYWDTRPESPLVDVGDAWGYWPNRKKLWIMLNDVEKLELVEIQKRGTGIDRDTKSPKNG